MTGVLTVDDWSPDIGVNDDISLASIEELELSGLWRKSIKFTVH